MPSLIDNFKNINKEKIIRPDYSINSLLDWEDEYDEFFRKLSFIDKYLFKVDNNTQANVLASINHIHTLLFELANKESKEYVADKNNCVANISVQLDAIMHHWPHFIVAAIEESGLLSISNLKSVADSVNHEIDKKIVEGLSSIKLESDEIINKAKEVAHEIEISARKTAEKISVAEAQEQFKNGANSNLSNIKIWGTISIVFILGFVVMAISMLNIKFNDVWTWQIIYYSAIRATILGFIGTILTFSLKMLKSQLHLREHNLHRLRISNSMAAFTESASTIEQRDIILSKLIESVSNFGNSGMINSEDDNSSKVTVDNITRSIGAVKG